MTPTEEVTEILLQRPDLRVERIISTGQASPPGFWYDQEEDEWVSVVQGEAALQWEDGSRAELGAGDWVLIPAHKKHRVERTSSKPPCVWLAIFMPPA
jgi:cupin 2 domain-containing protein